MTALGEHLIVRGYVAPTDLTWFDNLASRVEVDEVNFWRPSGANFKALSVGEPFFFKLKAPRNVIGGLGFYARTDRLPLWLAWETFGIDNGVPTQEALLRRVNANRDVAARPGSTIGCISLVSTRFFTPEEFVEVPRDWSASIVAGKGYDLETGEGQRLWQRCLERLPRPGATAGDILRFGTPRLVAPRLGQGSFRLAVYEAYDGSCAVTGEHSLPVLEAARRGASGLAPADRLPRRLTARCWLSGGQARSLRALTHHEDLVARALPARRSQPPQVVPQRGEAFQAYEVAP